MDRGYAKFKLFNEISAIGSSDVCRQRDHSVYQVEEDRPLTDADRAANVLSDQIVTFGKPTNNPITHPLRLVIVQIKPHVSKCKYKGGSSGVDSDSFLRIATNLLDVPAEIIAILDAYRWTIEIFYQPPAAASGSSSIYSATVICSATIRTASKSKPTARPSPAC